MKFRTYWHQMAGSTVDVELAEDDERVQQLLADHSVDTLEQLVAEGGVDAVRDFVTEMAYDELPGGVCAHCEGMFDGPGIELSGTWEPDMGDDGMRVLKDGEDA